MYVFRSIISPCFRQQERSVDWIVAQGDCGREFSEALNMSIRRSAIVELFFRLVLEGCCERPWATFKSMALVVGGLSMKAVVEDPL